MSSNLSVTVSHDLFLAVAVRTFGDTRQGTVMIVRQNGSGITAYGIGFVRNVSPEMFPHIQRAPRKSALLDSQLELLAVYLWMLRMAVADVKATSDAARDLIEKIIRENSDMRGRGFPETDRGMNGFADKE